MRIQGFMFRGLLMALFMLSGAVLMTQPAFAYSRSLTFPKSDSLLLAQIQAQVDADPILAKSQLQFDVANGDVTVSGRVSKKEQAMDLIIVVESIAGVQSVDVKGVTIPSGPLTSDELINSQVIGTYNREGLMGPLSRAPIANAITGPANVTILSPALPINIEVKTKHGVVYVSGTAPSQDAVDKAIDLARSISGVSDVKSTIKTP